MWINERASITTKIEEKLAILTPKERDSSHMIAMTTENMGEKEKSQEASAKFVREKGMRQSYAQVGLTM